LTNLPFEVVPLALFLLKLFFNQFLFSFSSLMLLDQPIDLHFKLFNYIDSHDLLVLSNFMFEFSFKAYPCQVHCRTHDPRSS
jgi:hypothetical protein